MTSYNSHRVTIYRVKHPIVFFSEMIAKYCSIKVRAIDAYSMIQPIISILLLDACGFQNANFTFQPFIVVGM